MIISGWSAFNAEIHAKDVPPPCTIGYSQTIDASPTETSTVYTLLKRSVAFCDQLGQEDVVIVLDQAIYCKAKEIIWQCPNEFRRVTLRMGAFHICCNFLGLLGQRYGDAGLSDVIIECGVVAPGSLPAVLTGHHYNRAIRAHKVVYEALLRLKWVEFVAWLEIHPEVAIDLKALSLQLQESKSNISAETFLKLVTMPAFRQLEVAFEKYTASERGPTAAFWESYISLVSLLLAFIRSTRSGNWALHKACVQMMLPWMFAYDHTNYSRYMTIYLWDMIQLHKEHPVADSELHTGGFAVQRCEGHPFSQIPVDQTIEQTINRDTKTPGGIIGFSQNKAATHRWLLTAHHRASVTQCCREMAGITREENSSHKEATLPRIRKDELCVNQIVLFLQDQMNPFAPSDYLTSLSSGEIASEKTTWDLLNAEKMGQEALSVFVQKRLNTQEVGYYDPLKKMKLSTYRKTSGKSQKAADKSAKVELHFFTRLLVVAQGRNMNIKEVFKYELSHVPLSLASSDGSLCKTTKSKLSHVLEKTQNPQQEIPVGKVLIVDGMALFHSLKVIPPTFQDLAQKVLKILLLQGDECGRVTRIDFVCDQYKDPSIKSSERNSRSNHGAIKVNILSPSQKCPKQWSKFLVCEYNKEQLVRVIHKALCSISCKCLEGREVFLTVGEDCYRLCESEDNTVESELVQELSTKQEEADVRMFLHASHAADQGHDVIFIRSPDTDVEVLALHHQEQIKARIILITGTQQKPRAVDVNALVGTLGLEVCRSLVGLHSITGTDTTSAFSGKGKQAGFHLVQTDALARKTMTLIGDKWNVTEELQTLCEMFVIHLYGLKIQSIDEARYVLFCTKNHLSQQLPPTRDALRNHVKRANYQAAIWKHALKGKADIPSPDGHGWTLCDNTLQVHWMDAEPAPHALMQLASCGCKTECGTRRCSCRASDLGCTDACKCPASCRNQRATFVEDYVLDTPEDLP